MDRKLGYQRLSKLLFRIDHLEIRYDSDTRKNFIEFHIMVYSRISTIFKVKCVLWYLLSWDDFYMWLKNDLWINHDIKWGIAFLILFVGLIFYLITFWIKNEFSAIFKITYIEWCLWEHTKTKRKRKRSKKQ